MFLIDLQPGRKAFIKDMTALNDKLKRRLVDLGVMEGAEVILKRVFPFGGPLTIEAAGQWIGIRRADARYIELEKRA